MPHGEYATGEWTSAILRIFGDDLIPSEITHLLGCEPTTCEVKGEESVGKKSGFVRIAKYGAWRLGVESREPGNLDAQIRELLAIPTQDLSVWEALQRRFELNLFCGFFMKKSNEVIPISAGNLRALGERGIEVWIDTYEPGYEDEVTEAGSTI